MCPGCLVLTADGSTLDDLRPVFLGRRQPCRYVDMRAAVDVSRGRGGLALRYDERFHASIEAASGGVSVRVVSGGLEQRWSALFEGVEAVLSITARPASWSSPTVRALRVGWLLRLTGVFSPPRWWGPSPGVWWGCTRARGCGCGLVRGCGDRRLIGGVFVCGTGPRTWCPGPCRVSAVWRCGGLSAPGREGWLPGGVSAGWAGVCVPVPVGR